MASTSKVIVTISGARLVVDVGVGLEIFALLARNKLEKRDYEFHSETKTMTELVKPMRESDVTLVAVSPEDYAMWKLAGVSVQS